MAPGMALAKISGAKIWTLDRRDLLLLIAAAMEQPTEGLQEEFMKKFLVLLMVGGSLASCTATEQGAGVGAAAGSAIGCEMQKDRAERQGVYTRNGYRLSAQIAPASYNRLDRTYVATTGVNLRAGPTTNSAKVGRLQPGQRFEALAKVRGSDWILVGQNGVGVGYVRDDFVRPDGRRYAGR